MKQPSPLTFTRPSFLRTAAVVGLTMLSTFWVQAAEMTTERPDAIRFAKTSLAVGEFYEPVEMAILPNLDVLIAQRRGEVLLYDHEDGEIYRAGFLDAYFETEVEGVRAEEGVLGIALDPDFAENHFVYIFYSPRDKVVNRLSRFVFEDRVLNIESEKMVLEFYSQRDICCHTAGSIAFGPDRLLYLSTGDNTTPFNEAGAEFTTDSFGPLNDLPNKQQFDARRSSGNTNDLRGKILRIRMLDDGTYEIPEGNLFPATDKTRPEIYTMGHRNPYRISVDPKNGTVYWGDVGPDAGEDTPARGPRGYDEMNRAPKAGNYGWPLFIGNNYAYRDYDYSNGVSGPAFNPAAPINDSANNTGLTELPPAQVPFIYYPYAPTPDFPDIGTGGRNAMAGPVYYKEFYPESTRLSDYYSGKVVMYDWIRNLFIAVTFDEDGKLAATEPFIDHLDFSGPIDVEMGPDGRIYVLEYGSGWFQKNSDSGLYRIDFIPGNLPPQIASVTVDSETGTLPFSISATAEVTDPEDDSIEYTWHIGSTTVTTSEPKLKTTLDTPGVFELTLTATDTSGSSATSESTQLYAGNEQPQVSISVKGNQSLYFPDEPISYRVSIKDDSKVVSDHVHVSAEMIGRAPAANQGHKILSRADEGEILVFGSDCIACHKVAEKSIGPSFEQIALRYRGDSSAVALLSNKILNGGGGVWGEVPMAAHPGMSESSVSKIVEWVLSNAEEEDTTPSLAIKGKITPTEYFETARRQTFMLKASYSDMPGEPLLPLTTENFIALRPSTYIRFWFDENEGFENDGFNLLFSEKRAFIKIGNIDLKGIQQLILKHDFETEQAVAVSVHLDSAEGETIGTAAIGSGEETKVRLKRARGKSVLRDLYISFEFENAPAEKSQLQTIEFSKAK